MSVNEDVAPEPLAHIRDRVALVTLAGDASTRPTCHRATASGSP